MEFLKEPKVYRWMKGGEVDFLKGMNKALVPFLASLPDFKDKDIKVGYFSDIGESSFVAVVEGGGKKLVFKTTQDPKAITAEVSVLKEWGKHGVKVPSFYQEGLMGDHPYVMMNYIEEPVLREAYSLKELMENGLIKQMGETLKKMSGVKGSGFGRPTNSIFEGTYTSFQEYIKQALMENQRLDFLRGKEYLDKPLINKLEKAVEIIAADINANNVQSTICHLDFSVYNIFATDPITVFDPGEARLNHPYIDLAQSLIIFFNLSNDIAPIKEEFLNGYLLEREKIRNEVLSACLCIQGVKKLNTWVRKERYAKARILKNFISELSI